MNPEQSDVYELVKSFPNSSATARDIHGLRGRSSLDRAYTNKILGELRRMGVLESQPTNNRRLGTRWSIKAEAQS